MSRKYFHTPVYVIAVFLLMLVTSTACEKKLHPSAKAELEAEIHSGGSSVDDYEISTISIGANEYLPSSIDARWCVEVIINSNGQNTIEHYLLDRKGKFFECKQLTEDQLTFEETGCSW